MVFNLTYLVYTPVPHTPLSKIQCTIFHYLFNLEYLEINL